VKTVTFWTSVIIATFIIFAGVALISSPEESGSEGYIGAEPKEDAAPATVFYDFTDEPPMLITPNMAHQDIR